MEGLSHNLICGSVFSTEGLWILDTGKFVILDPLDDAFLVWIVVVETTIRKIRNEMWSELIFKAKKYVETYEVKDFR